MAILLTWLIIVTLIAFNMEAVVNWGGAGKLVGGLGVFPLVLPYILYREGQRIQNDIDTD